GYATAPSTPLKPAPLGLVVIGRRSVPSAPPSLSPSDNSCVHTAPEGLLYPEAVTARAVLT
ncbi:MAG: hypothetical protein ACT4QE_25915, partial [Anaerolineales bacterium]